MTKKNSEGIVNHQKQRSYDIYNRVYSTLYEMILRDEKINYYTVAKQAEVSRTYLYNHNAFSMMIETFSNLQKENESEDSLYEKFEQAEKRYVELQLEYDKEKAKYNAWRKENDRG
ncbi:MAG: hypothetical protein HFG81_01645 [Dorea sp.]|nr:hypothetical protein [Dorea sp.]